VSSEGGLAGSITDLGRNLKARGFSDAEVERAVKSAEQLNAARSLAAQRAAAFDENLRAAAAIGQIPEMDLKKRVEGSPSLTVLASTGVPMLRHLWGMYVEYKKRRAGSAVGFDRYVWYLTKHLRGDFGEFELAFALGDGFLLLKSPDHRPTIPGTDVVAVCRATGEIWVLDNKAFQSAGAIAAVGALTKNLPKNLIADMQEYSRSYGDPAQLTVDVAGPLRRLELAAEAVRAYVAGPPVKDVTKDDVQVEITNILARPEFRIRRVVSAAAGASSGVTPRLEKIGLDYLNLQEGEAEPEAPLITVP